MMISNIPYQKYLNRIDNAITYRYNGRVEDIVGLCIEASGPSVSIGDLCFIETNDTTCDLKAEVVGFKNNRVYLMPLGDMRGLRPGAKIYSNHQPMRIPVGDKLLGRVLNGEGKFIDNLPHQVMKETYSIMAEPPNPMDRHRITEPIETGVRSIDSLLTVGKGQRVGIFSGSGVGKSSLMGMIARYTNADVTVIGLVGERGREVRDFIDRDLGEEGLKKSVLVVETGDKPALTRLNAAYTATTIAEYFRDQGKDVILMIDSVTRIAMAQREIGLAVGEPPATKGYTPSVFSMLPKFLERSGTSDKGSITGFYTVLVEGDDFNEPISDAARSILDGHIYLSRELASMGHYPAIDILGSVSRLMPEIVSKEHYQSSLKFRQMMGAYKEAEDLINIGAYVKGTNPRIDEAVSKYEHIRKFLQQDINVNSLFSESVKGLEHLITLPIADEKETASA